MRLYELLPTIGALVLEARSNPDLNPRLGTWRELEKYSHDPNIFIHFTNPIVKQTDSPKRYEVNGQGVHPQLKLGINPQYSFQTPAGIYAYNLQQFIRSKGKNFSGFGTDRSYIYVLKWNGAQNFQDMEHYTTNDWNNDLEKLKKLYPNRLDDIDQAMKTTNIKGPIGLLWNVTRIVSGTSKKWNTLLRTLGYSGFNDMGGGAYSQFEYAQAIFLSKSAFTVVDVIHKHQNELRTESDLADILAMKPKDILELYRHNYRSPHPKIVEKLLSSKDTVGSAILWISKVHRITPEILQVISSHPNASYLYARDIIKKRFELGEPRIIHSGDSDLMFEYAKNIINGRWREAEPYIRRTKRYDTIQLYKAAEKELKYDDSELEELYDDTWYRYTQHFKMPY